MKGHSCNPKGPIHEVMSLISQGDNPYCHTSVKVTKLQAMKKPVKRIEGPMSKTQLTWQKILYSVSQYLTDFSTGNRNSAQKFL